MRSAALCSSAILFLMLASPARASFSYETPESDKGSSKPLSNGDSTIDESPLTNWSSDDSNSKGGFGDHSTEGSQGGDKTFADDTSDPTGGAVSSGSTSQGVPSNPDSQGAPEPATYALTGLGLLAVPFLRKFLKRG